MEGPEAVMNHPEAVMNHPEAIMNHPEAVMNHPDGALLGDQDSTRLLSSILLGLGLLASLLVLHLQTNGSEGSWFSRAHGWGVKGWQERMSKHTHNILSSIGQIIDSINH